MLIFSGNEMLLLFHPVTTEPEKSKNQVCDILQAITKLKRTTIAITPNSDVGHKAIFNQLKLFSRKFPFINLYTSIPRTDFLGMIKICGVLVGNSSSGMIEASSFNTPVVNIGIRQQDRERGTNVINVENVKSSLIYNAINKALWMKKHKNFKKLNLYGDGKASFKIVKHLETIVLNKQLIQKQIFY